MDAARKTTDGRFARSERTRSAVAEAMLDCLEDGILRPSAEVVAKRAGVSKRAVFRHFENLEALLNEVSDLQIKRVLEELPPIVTEGTLDERIGGMVANAARRNELIAPVRRAAVLSEPFSEVIRERQAWLRSKVRRAVRRVFAEELDALTEAERSSRVAALRVLLSFSYWEELRRHENLSVAAATRVLGAAMQAVLRAPAGKRSRVGSRTKAAS
jgi:TetR/AcrR family transcriptional regulator of autoinduction and epiphytic fitness